MSAATSHAAGREGKSVEEIYQKKTQLEHILLRPDTYVGSTEMQSQELWVFDAVQSRMTLRTIQYVPALYKIFDEILVNAADNLIRDPVGMDTIKVDIDPISGTLSVFNNGKGLPVVVHKEHHVYVPELVFGHLLSSDNYNDNDGKVVGGRNGYGAKLANVFSTEFVIETADGSKKFHQTYRDNMTQKEKPVVVANKSASFTRVTFTPDLAKFGMTEFDDDIVSLFTKRVYDIAGSTAEKCKVYLNGECLDVHNFRDYSDLYLLTRTGVPQIYETCSERWEVCVSLTEGGFQQVSFVNSIATVRGGTHVTHVTDQIVEHVLEKAKVQSKEKMKGGIDVRPHHVKNYIWVFVRCLIENPAFDSQTKETLMTKQSKFGSKCEMSAEFLDKVASCGIIDLILTAAMAKTKVDLGKKLKAKTAGVTRLTGVPKLEDANEAGGKSSRDCTLILTEGDSAKALAVAGLSVVGRNYFGVFPLRGKVLNVRDATLKQMMNNEEIQNLIKIMGLDWNKQYDEELKGLRYGSIMIMTDQDHDGSHIKGLIINLIHAWWPSLLKMPGFLKEFFTPIVKSTKGKQVLSFYTMPEYETWKAETNNGKGWRIKYYKGLGTSTTKEAKEYFGALETHKLSYLYEGDEDDNAVDLAFNKKRADDRKAWMNAYEEGQLVDHTQAEVSYKDFINKELVLFSKANVIRAIPSVIDGLKPSQRKVLFGCFKRKLKKDLKVAQLVGYVSEHVAYHHGEGSLTECIIAMAQDFVGSNNLNLLVPQGQFGTRLQGGKDSAAARYIYTRLAPVARAIFPEADDHVLDYLNEEGLSIEPRYFCPVIPMALVNGIEGIGTGWSSSVPNYNPRDIIRNLRKAIRGEDFEEMTPWYQGFTGSIQKGRDGRYEVTGVIQASADSTQATITELPVRKWTQDYREFLEENMPKGERKSSSKLLDDYQEFHTERTVHFEVQISTEGRKTVENTSLVQAFKLRSSLNVGNMILFDHTGQKVKKYDSAQDIMEEFMSVRLAMYGERKKFLVNRLTRRCDVLSERARFVQMVIKKEIVIKRRKIVDLAADLRSKGFKAVHELRGTAGAEGDLKEDDEEEEEAGGEEDDGSGNADDNEENAEEDGDDAAEDGAEQSGGASGSGSKKKGAGSPQAKATRDFEYLLGMPISTLTAEKVEELLRERDARLAELSALQKRSLEQMWMDDLDELEKVLNDRDAQIAKEAADEKAQRSKQRKKSPQAARKKEGATLTRGATKRGPSPTSHGEGAVGGPAATAAARKRLATGR